MGPCLTHSALPSAPDPPSMSSPAAAGIGRAALRRLAPVAWGAPPALSSCLVGCRLSPVLQTSMPCRRIPSHLIHRRSVLGIRMHQGGCGCGGRTHHTHAARTHVGAVVVVAVAVVVMVVVVGCGWPDTSGSPSLSSSPAAPATSQRSSKWV